MEVKATTPYGKRKDRNTKIKRNDVVLADALDYGNLNAAQQQAVLDLLIPMLAEKLLEEQD